MYTPLDFVFARPGAIRVLRALEPLDGPVSAREAARRAGLSPGASSVLEQLQQVGILTRRETAVQYLYSYNRAHVLADALGQLLNAEREAEQRLFAEIRAILAAFEVLSVIIYGSRAAGRARASSDVDVLVIVQTPAEVDEAYHTFVDRWISVRDRFGVSLSPVVMHAAEARRQWAAGNAFLLAAAKDARLVTGASLDQALR